MADHELHKCQFWLPPKFLSQDHDETEFLAELTKRLHQYTTGKKVILDEQFLKDIDNPRKTDRSWNIATSPQSTLSDAMGMGGYHIKQASSCGSPNCSTPPHEEVKNKNNNMEATELLYAAAEEVTRLQQNAGTDYLHFCTPPQTPCPNQQKSIKKKQKAVQYMQQVHRDETRHGNIIGHAPGFLPSAWPTMKMSQFHEQPKPAGSGRKAVILGNQITKSERSGTGVFLPRPAGSWKIPSPEVARKKPDLRSCNFQDIQQLLLPERVVQALNLNLRAMETPNQLNKNDFFHQQYSSKDREHVLPALAQQRQDKARSTWTCNELQLPQEWTY